MHTCMTLTVPVLSAYQCELVLNLWSGYAKIHLSKLSKYGRSFGSLADALCTWTGIFQGKNLSHNMYSQDKNKVHKTLLWLFLILSPGCARQQKRLWGFSTLFVSLVDRELGVFIVGGGQAQRYIFTYIFLWGQARFPRKNLTSS